MRHGDKFRLWRFGALEDWVVTTPEEVTPVAVVHARRVLAQDGLLGPEAVFSLELLRAELERHPDGPPAPVGPTGETVEPRGAIEWTCNHCGRDHFQRMISAELSEEDREEVMAHFDLPEGAEGDLMMIPKGVTCPDCGAEYKISRE